MNDIVLIYDINALPEQLPFDVMIKMFEEHKVVIWDSIGCNGGYIPEPKVVSTDNEIVIKMIDTKTLNKGEIHRLINSFTNGK